MLLFTLLSIAWFLVTIFVRDALTAIAEPWSAWTAATIVTVTSAMVAAYLAW